MRRIGDAHAPEAASALAEAIATDVIGRGTVWNFMRGLDDGVIYGLSDSAFDSYIEELRHELEEFKKSSADAVSLLLSVGIVASVGGLNTSPDFEAIRGEAVRRIGDAHAPEAASALAEAIATSVIGRGTVWSFLRGLDDGVIYGIYELSGSAFGSHTEALREKLQEIKESLEDEESSSPDPPAPVDCTDPDVDPLLC